MIMTDKRWAQGMSLIVKLIWGGLCLVSSAGWTDICWTFWGLSGYTLRSFLFLGLFVSLDIKIGLPEGETR